MKGKPIRIVIVIISLITMLVIGLSATTPELYTIEKTPVASSHYNPNAFEGATNPTSKEMIPLMTELLNSTASVMLGIQSGDLDGAEEELARMVEQTRYFDSRVERLKGSKGDIGTFQKQNQQIIADLQDLLRDSREHKSLTQGAAQEKGINATEASDVAYRAEALRLKMDETSQAIMSRNATVMDISERLGLPSQLYVTSVEGLNKTIPDAGELLPGLPAPDETEPPYKLTIVLDPANASYGSLLTIGGMLTGTETPTDDAIDVYIDGKIQGKVYPDTSGRYSWHTRIERIGAGKHIAYAGSSHAFSQTEFITVKPLATTLTLQAAPERISGTMYATCSGNLTANGMPISNAPITLMVDGNSLYTINTTTNGEYSAILSLEPGAHTICASFSDQGFPLYSADSAPLNITIPRSSPSTSLLQSLLSLTLLLVGMFFYFRLDWARVGGAWRGRRVQENIAPPPLERVSVPHEKPPLSLESFLAEIHSACEGGDATGSLHRIYLRILDLLSDTFSLQKIRSLTPREIGARIAPSDVTVPFQKFIKLHEEIRYAGRVPDADDIVAAISFLTEIEGILMAGEQH
jgi:hypothetical protein